MSDQQSTVHDSQKKLDPLDIGSLFHAILFAYQKSVKEILGSGATIFVHPVLNIVQTIHEKTGVNLIKGRDIDEVFENLSEIMPTSGMVREFRFEKLDPERYILHVEGCAWAPHIHEELKPTDVVCPLALLAMSIFQKTTKTKVRVADSEYTKTGTNTIIEPISH
jgi:hypothetical protein